MLVKKAGYNQS